MTESWFRRRDDGIDLFVRLTPRSGVDAIDSVAADAAGKRHLVVRVRAVPEKGAANIALERLLAGELRLGRSAVEVVAGQTSRLKTVRITGDPDALAAAAALFECKA
jgi:uncharacterized protein YggU (UPF0235/DUF167 family)